MSRLIVKGLPSNCTEKGLKEFFGGYGNITDCTLKYTKEGKFRKFAFIGFDNDDAAKNALNQANNSFLQSSKIQVEVCHPFGDSNKPRAWSKFAKDSSAYQRSFPDASNSHEVRKLRNPGNQELNTQFEIGIMDSRSQNQSTLTPEEDPLKPELLDGIVGDTKLSLILTGLPASIKQKSIKDWLAPVRTKAMKIVRNETSAAAFVSFNRNPDVRRALQMDDTYLGGYKITLKRVNETDGLEQAEESFPESNKVMDLDIKKEEEEIRDTILETGRVFVRNLPFSTKEDDLRFLFKKFGELSDIQVIIDKKTGNCKGFAIIDFIFPENAVAAYSELDGSIFKGRMLHIIAGKERRENKEGDENPTEETTLRYKATKEKKLKTTAGTATHSWNALFLGPNAIADSLAEKLGKEKRDLFNPEDGKGAGVKLALAETNLVQETRNFLMENGVKLDVFSRPAGKRSNKVILVKNLPLGTQSDELERMFARYGDCSKVIFPERGISALVVMGNIVDAKKAFQSLAYSRFRTKPLFLEWAPGDIFGEEANETSSTTKEEAKEEDSTKINDRKRRGEDLSAEDKKELRKSKKLKKFEEERAKVGIEIKEEDEESGVNNSVETSKDNHKEEKEVYEEPIIEPESTVFVKNLSFETTDAQLEAFFKKRGFKFQYAQISKKLNPADPLKKLSMGFGFVQFYTKANAEQAVKEMQGCLLDGHSLELKISNRELQDEKQKTRKDASSLEQNKCTKILVKNLPFQASIKEIEELFSTFGEVKTIRIPKKMGTRDQHRGFGFVDFMSIGEAKRAFEALVHSTHLYGRRLVLEWAKADDTVEELRTKTATKYSGNVGAKKRVKKRIDDLQAEIFAAGNAGDPDEEPTV